MNILLLVAVAIAACASLYLEARQPHRQDPFELVVTQDNPPIQVFVHRPTGRCFLAYKAGGLLSVERVFCETLPPLTPPVGPPVSPEQ